MNIGSGVSILKVTGPDEFSRISGTSVSMTVSGSRKRKRLININSLGEVHCGD